MKTLFDKKEYIVSLFFLIVLNGHLWSQTCGSCTVNISTHSNDSYTVDVGQVFCIDSIGNFTGTLTVNGGTVCNNGIFKPDVFTFNSGVVQNHSRILINSNFNIDSTKTVTCEKKSLFSVKGDFTISGGSFVNKGISNVYYNITYSAGTFNNSGIVNCRLLSGNTSSITNTGIINKD